MATTICQGCPRLKICGPGTLVWPSKCACMRWEIVVPFNTLHSTRQHCGLIIHELVNRETAMLSTLNTIYVWSWPESPAQRVCGLLNAHAQSILYFRLPAQYCSSFCSSLAPPRWTSPSMRTLATKVKCWVKMLMLNGRHIFFFLRCRTR